jgi:uncharacterized protein (DUF2147 family)
MSGEVQSRGLTMTANMKRALVAFPLVLMPGAVSAASSPLGTWIDHTGRGAVEITDCNGALCGRVVWVKDTSDEDGCNMQIIGNVKPVAGGKWDGGWIYDPERRSKFDVELTPIGDQKLKVHGYAGMKLFGETMTWTRAPADLKKCGQKAAVPSEAVRPVEPQLQTQAQSPAPQQQAEQTASNSPGAAPQQEASPRPDSSRSQTQSIQDALGAMLKFSEGPAGSKQKTCTVSVKDLGKFSFPC